MKHECPTYLKSIGKSKALTSTLSDTEPEDDSDNENDEILNAFTSSVDPTKGIVEDVDEEEDLVDSKFEKMDDQDDIHTAYEKLYRLATKKLSDVELDREEFSTKFDEANQTIGALRFENNFLAEKTNKLEAELFQVRAQLEKASSAKLDEMQSIQKFAFDRTSLGGALNIDLPLSKFSLAKLVLTLLFSISTLLLRGTKTVALVEAILEEEKSYPKPVQLEADF